MKYQPYVCNACGRVLDNQTRPDLFKCDDCNQHYCQPCYEWHLGIIGHNAQYIDTNLFGEVV